MDASNFDDLLKGVKEGRVSRRSMVKQAAAFGLSASAILSLLGATAPSAMAQATPEGDAEPGNEPLEPVPTEGLAENQVFRYGFSPAWLHFDPAQEAGYGRWIIPLVFTPLFQFKGKGTSVDDLIPGLCTGFELSDDGLIYTLHVDPAAVWTDGAKVTAAEIKAWMEYISSAANPGPYKATLADVVGHAELTAGETEELSGVVAVDDETLTIELLKANPLFAINVLFDYRLGGTRADVAKANPTGWWLENPPTNGPFAIDSLDFDANEFTFVPSETWWGTAPTLQRIEAIGNIDQQTLMLMFENGQLDAMFVFGEEAIQMEINYPETVQPMPGAGGMFFWALNYSLEPTSDINVRKALRHSVDANGIANAVYQGQRNAARGPIWQAGIVGSRFEEIESLHDFFTYDLALAAEDLAASEYGSASALPVLNVSPGGTAGDKVRATEIMVEMWRSGLGISNIDVRADAAAFGEELAADVINVNRISAGGIPDAANMVKSLAESTGAQAIANFGGYSNPELDALVNLAYYMDRADPAYPETVAQAEDMYLDDYMYIPLMIDPYSYYVQPWLKNLRSNRHNVIYTLADMFLLSQE
jgi:peptide/nickel transport system substrate-binding protein